ncbi:hypothetical protein NDU88_006245 [Pleurodeles waltl]|uniref:Uncharacterized protein n=1 Tax=Pleurodeles waltl TaxID=8319 RepID=A0AAV7RKY0_PLEWA|nr:hypothetical protein NDU88_006245 [Pleurodeles waltl]
MRNAARHCVEEAAAWLPLSDFLHFSCCVLVVGWPPEVELRACWPFDVCSSATWASTAVELGAVRSVLEEGSGLHDCAPKDVRAGPGGLAQNGFGKKGPRRRAEDQSSGGCGGAARERPIGLSPKEVWRWLEMWDKVTPGRPERTGLAVHRASGVDGPDWRTRGESQMEGSTEQVVDIDNRTEIQQDKTVAEVTPGLADGSRGVLDQVAERIPTDT